MRGLVRHRRTLHAVGPQPRLSKVVLVGSSENKRYLELAIVVVETSGGIPVLQALNISEFCDEVNTSHVPTRSALVNSPSSPPPWGGEQLLDFKPPFMSTPMKMRQLPKPGKFTERKVKASTTARISDFIVWVWTMSIDGRWSRFPRLFVENKPDDDTRDLATASEQLEEQAAHIFAEYPEIVDIPSLTLIGESWEWRVWRNEGERIVCIDTFRPPGNGNGRLFQPRDYGVKEDNTAIANGYDFSEDFKMKWMALATDCKWSVIASGHKGEPPLSRFIAQGPLLPPP